MYFCDKMNTDQISNEVKETAIIATFTCPCRPGFQYKSKSALDAHKKTKMHLSFEKSTDLKNTQASSKKLENQIESLKTKLEQKEATIEPIITVDNNNTIRDYYGEKLPKPIYGITKTISSTSEDGDESETIIIYQNTNIFEVIKEGNITRSKDILKNKKDADCYNYNLFTISYDLIKYVYVHGGVQYLDCLCVDDYRPLDDWESDDEKELINNYKNTIEKTFISPIFDINKAQKNIRKIIENSKQSDRKKLTWIGNSKLNHVGNITYNDVIEKLNVQEYKCYK